MLVKVALFKYTFGVVFHVLKCGMNGLLHHLTIHLYTTHLEDLIGLVCNLLCTINQIAPSKHPLPFIFVALMHHQFLLKRRPSKRRNFYYSIKTITLLSITLLLILIHHRQSIKVENISRQLQKWKDAEIEVSRSALCENTIQGELITDDKGICM